MRPDRHNEIFSSIERLDMFVGLIGCPDMLGKGIVGETIFNRSWAEHRNFMISRALMLIVP